MLLFIIFYIAGYIHVFKKKEYILNKETFLVEFNIIILYIHVNQPIDQPPDQRTNQPTNRQTSQSTDRPTDQNFFSRV